MTSFEGTSDPSVDDPTHQRFVLGVDGGGTKTEAWLAKLTDHNVPSVIGRGLTGSSNLVAVGGETALHNLQTAIEQAAAQAGIPVSSISAAVLALAGSGNTATRCQIEEFVKNQLAIHTTQIIHDGRAVLLAGTPEGFGVALIAGTGAVAFGENAAGKTRIVGGWGYWFGDEGSAYWIGQRALRAISQAEDGRAEPTALTDAILRRLEANEPRELLTKLSDTDNVRQAIAELADLVCDLAQQGDQVAASILGEAADHWCSHICTLARQFDFNEPIPLCYAGGVFRGSNFARTLLTQRLTDQGIEIGSAQLVAAPVEGCIRLAAVLCGD